MSSSDTETVLVVGSTGNIGVAAVKGALNSKRNVLAIVRNQASADKLIRHVGSSQGITFAEADISSDTGVQRVVEKVREGQLPAFQHVYSCVGGEYVSTPLTEITTEQLRYNFNIAFEANFFAYRATIPYLLAQKHPTSTWTLCTGAQGETAFFPVPGMTQGALFTMSTAAARENEKTNVRFNEVYLCFRVEVDEQAEKHGVTSASEFAKVYENLLGDEEVRGARVTVREVGDIGRLVWQRKF
ncbi:hypothetical protein AA0119_g12565 [Alternaria tenuissima]|uniref:NmrA-like domain-containing protein n=1 Tax=Alternaria tenuissima TaxID=119927 RepID=A0AB37W022_9PLEO|nr:NAD(P)-binding protein [Alternaria alternata]RYN15998.1 hypothetical protein AA0115_g12632 [Alternaria tenuissima]RYN72870.1 hypothetical protein AA0120_g12690 [Alternaria tenuissima]RYN87211.1 hypothetical protein AA0119_g12565 [Alternaria tenuissima]RYO04317.1 hypothetical protein AA0121_g12877 [Alternaria tenuissima]